MGARIKRRRRASFHKLRGELQRHDRLQDPLARAEQKSKWRAIHKGARVHTKRKRGAWG